MKFYDEFPKPVGKFTVGRTQIDFKYKASDNSERELTALFFYPSDSSVGKPTAEYAFPELLSLRAETLVKLGTPGDEHAFASSFKTWCYDDLALSEREKNYPVLFFSHGAGTCPQIGTMFCQDLASVGYIVVSIGHQGSGVYKLKDGRLVHSTDEFIDGSKEYFKEITPILMSTPQAMVEKLEEEKAIEVSRGLLLGPAAVEKARQAAIQSEDTRYVADCLSKMNAGDIESMFKGRFQLEIGMGVFGHSHGGTIAAAVCLEDDRFVGGINYDGGMYGYLTSDLRKPFMQLSTVFTYNYNAIFESNNAGAYFVVIDKSNHYEFCDALFTHRSEAIKGTRDAMEMRNIVTTYTMAFFDRHLLKKEAEIENLAFDGVEMIKRSKKLDFRRDKSD